MSSVIAEFIENARGLSIADAAPVLGLKVLGRRSEHAQPCPACGGHDGFAFNTQKNKWNCRHAGVGGNDAIGMAAHINGLDIKRREGFLAACGLVLGQSVPVEGEQESDADRRARLNRLAAMKKRNAIQSQKAEKQAEDYREKERSKARGIYDRADFLSTSPIAYGREYLLARCGGYAPQWEWLRVAENVPYWHNDEVLYEGAAIIAPFMDIAHTVIGCHITWVDMAVSGKYRPLLKDQNSGELLPSKKMRGTKKGGIIPLSGEMESIRWVGGEGIENGMAVAASENYRADTFYFAAGDLGNLSGAADPSSRFPHPFLTKTDRNGVARRVFIAGPEPKKDQADGEAMFVPDHVTDLVLLADGDSEPIMTASAMVRAKARLSHKNRRCLIIFPPKNEDFANMARVHHD